MSSLNRLTCPHCRREGSTPKPLTPGSRIQCPACGTSFPYTPTDDTYKSIPPQGETPFILDETGQSLNLGRLEISRAKESPANDPYFSQQPPKRSPSPGLATNPSTRPPSPRSRTSNPAERPAVASPPPIPNRAVKNCIYCGEEILAVALKCKHCGEIVDPALRTAEEAKVLASRNSSPSVVNVNTNTAVSTSTSVAVGGRRWRQLSRLIGAGLLLFLAGPFVSLAAPSLGIILTLIGFLAFCLGLILSVIRLFYRF